MGPRALYFSKEDSIGLLPPNGVNNDIIPMQKIYRPTKNEAEGLHRDN